MQSFVASDGVKLSYKRMGSGVPLIMLHGWSASHRSFDLNAKAIATYCCELVMPDLRFHGESDKPDWGFHVARLAADLRELLAEIGFHRPACVGCSLGAAIIWSFCELYGCELLGRVCFVDQAPCQWRLPDWSFCSKGIYDEASLANITAALQVTLRRHRTPPHAHTHLLPLPLPLIRISLCFLFRRACPPSPMATPSAA
jgi:pimeloyl-ACP methyl ester carboxylesterase